MRRLAVFVLTAALLGQGAAHAGEISRQEGTFALAAPCAIVCSYWVDQLFAPCENDFPPGSYSEILTDPAPAHDGRVLVGDFKIFPTVDWDAFVCSYPERKLIAQGANILGEVCRGMPPVPPNILPVGCDEYASWVATPGKRYTLLAYNWSDYAELPYRLRWWSVS